MYDIDMCNRVDSPTDFLSAEKTKLRAKNISATACANQEDVVVTDTIVNTIVSARAQTTSIIILLSKDDVILRMVLAQ
jgi:hypothetical protein